MQPVRPPASPHAVKTYPYSLFLGGTIDMGNSTDWQADATTWLAKHAPHIMVFNPRRDNWDASWKQELTNPQFLEQVAWEHYCFTEAKCSLIYFAPGSASPISLMELGILAATRPASTIIVCPSTFYRAGNVEFTCKQYKVPLARDLETGLQMAVLKLAYGPTDRMAERMLDLKKLYPFGDEQHL